MTQTYKFLIKNSFIALIFAVMSVIIHLPKFPLKTVHATTTGYVGEYWNNPLGPGGESPDFPGGDPVYTHTDENLDFNWGYGSPNGAVHNEDFIARWTKTAYFGGGTYQFTAAADDGVRVYIDDNMIINAWVDQGAGTVHNASIDITAGQHTIKVEYYENGAVAEIHFSYTNQTDTDNDGISNTIENAGPNNGDANNDGTADSEQVNVTSFVDPVTGEYSALDISNGCSIRSAKVEAESSNSTHDMAFDYPAGLMHFTVDCDTVGATIQIAQYYFDFIPSNLVARKYNSSNHSYQAIPSAEITQATVGGTPASRVTYQVTDGGMLDEDGIEDGTIIDPTGLGSAVVSAPNTGI